MCVCVALQSTVNFYRTNLWDILVGFLRNPSFKPTPGRELSLLKAHMVVHFLCRAEFFLAEVTGETRRGGIPG